MIFFVPGPTPIMAAGMAILNLLAFWQSYCTQAYRNVLQWPPMAHAAQRGTRARHSRMRAREPARERGNGAILL